MNLSEKKWQFENSNFEFKFWMNSKRQIVTKMSLKNWIWIQILVRPKLRLFLVHMPNTEARNQNAAKRCGCSARRSLSEFAYILYIPLPTSDGIQDIGSWRALLMPLLNCWAAFLCSPPIYTRRARVAAVLSAAAERDLQDRARWIQYKNTPPYNLYARAPRW